MIFLSLGQLQHFQDQEEKEVVYDVIASPVTAQPSTLQS